MKTRCLFILAATVSAPFSSGTLVAQVIDSPGPGYRAQAELFSPKKTPPDIQVIGPAVLPKWTNVDFISDPKVSAAATMAPFSEPIRLFPTPAAKQ
jgi:hypothetical protein